MSAVGEQLVIGVAAILIGGGITGLFVGTTKLLGVVREIKKEVLPNGGSSLRDSVDRIERKQRKHERELRKLKEQLHRSTSEQAAGFAAAA